MCILGFNNRVPLIELFAPKTIISPPMLYNEQNVGLNADVFPSQIQIYEYWLYHNQMDIYSIGTKSSRIRKNSAMESEPGQDRSDLF